MVRVHGFLVMTCVVLPTSSSGVAGERPSKVEQGQEDPRQSRASSSGKVQVAYLKASNAESLDKFGQSVAVSGDIVVVGAWEEDGSATGVNGNQGTQVTQSSGAAYLFVRNGTGWDQPIYLKASNTGFMDLFGIAVAASGDTVVVGAPGEASNAMGVNGNQGNDVAPRSGAAYVFVRDGTTWSQQAYLKASNTGAGDNFGGSVSISGDTVVVGAMTESSSSTGVNGDQGNDDAPRSGAAYVFVRDGTTWSQQAYLKASNTQLLDQFGASVSVSGNTVVATAFGEDSSSTGVNGDQDDNSLFDAGAAYVFVRNGTLWSQQAYLKASNTGDGDLFGLSASLSNDTVVVGAYKEDGNATGVGGNQEDDSAPDAGAAYVFVRGGTSWSQEAYLKASNTEEGDSFGVSVSVSGNRVVVGASEDSNGTGLNGDPSDNSAESAGAAYVFGRRGTIWSQEAYVKASNSDAGDRFTRTAVSNDVVVVGAPFEDSIAVGVNGDEMDNSAPDAGAAYVFDLSHRASVAFRSAGSNPASYSASPAVLGGNFTATVDNNLAAQGTSLLFAFEAPSSLALGSGRTLLCMDAGSGELFTGSGLAPTSTQNGVDSYSMVVTNNPAACGVVLYSQAIQLGNPPFVLSNAQDLTIGSF